MNGYGNAHGPRFKRTFPMVLMMGFPNDSGELQSFSFDPASVPAICRALKAAAKAVRGNRDASFSLPVEVSLTEPGDDEAMI